MKKHINTRNFLICCALLCLTPFILIGQYEWNQKADFGGKSREGAVVFSIDSSVYIGTGYDLSGFRKDFWRWDQATDTWTQIADFGGTARYQAVAFSIDGKGYVGTGSNSNGMTQDFWEYDPISDKWTAKSNFGGGKRNLAVSFTINDKGYVGTGVVSLQTKAN